MLKQLSLAFALLLCASTAFAQEAWRKGPDTGDQLCSGGVGPGTSCFWMFNNSTTDSPLVRIAAEYATVCFDPNTASATNTGATVRVQYVTSDDCANTVVSVNTSEPYEAKTMTGAATGGLSCLFSVPTGCLWIDPQSTSAVESMVKVTGAPGPRQ